MRAVQAFVNKILQSQKLICNQPQPYTFAVFTRVYIHGTGQGGRLGKRNSGRMGWGEVGVGVVCFSHVKKTLNNEKKKNN